MNRAATWRMSTPAVRYDYAPRSWDTHHQRFHLSDLIRRETLGPLMTRLFRLALYGAAGSLLLYAGLNYRLTYLGDGTIRVERKAAWAMSGMPAAAAPALATIGTVPSQAAPASRPGAVDATPPPARPSLEDEACKGRRATLAEAVSAYNQKFPGTPIRTMQNLALIDAAYAATPPSCPGDGRYILAFRADAVVVRCSTHK